jgi:hypothetical protein
MYFHAPERYDAHRSGCFSWLGSIGFHKVIDAQRARRRVAAHEVSSGIDLARSVPPRAAGENAQVELERWTASHRKQLLAFPWSPRERAFLEARLDDAGLLAQAAALGAADLPEAAQRKAVNAAWNRLYNRFKLTRLRQG